MLALWGFSNTKSKYSYLAFFPVNLKALWTVLRGEKISFPVTPKSRQEGVFLHLVWPQLGVILLTTIALLFAWARQLAGAHSYGLDGLLLNTFWGCLNIIAMSGIVYAALWKPLDSNSENNTGSLNNDETEMRHAA